MSNTPQPPEGQPSDPGNPWQQPGQQPPPPSDPSQQPGAWQPAQQPGSWQQPQQPGAWEQSQQQRSWDQSQQQGSWDQSQQPGAWQSAQQSNPYGQQAGWYPPPPQAPTYASFGKRAYGWLFDYFLPGIVISAVSNVISPATRVSASGELVVQANWSQTLLQLGLFLVLAAYSAKTGQTWGRRIAKTQLVGEDGRPISLGRGFLRYICHLVDSIILFIGWLFPLWDPQRQTLADKIMKTYVLDVSATGPINIQP